MFTVVKHLKLSLLNFIQSFKRKINDFLFSEGHFEKLGLFRFVLCSVLLYIACYRQLNVDQFGPDSIVPNGQALNLYYDYYRPFLQLFFWPDDMAWLVHGIYIFLLIIATLGFSNRILMLLTWIIAQGFIQRNFSLLFGADVIGNLFLFYLSFTRCHESFTLKKYLFRNKTPEFNSNLFSDQLSTVFFRLLQFQLVTIYTYTGFEKLKGNSWWDGTALWTVLVNPQFTSFDLLFLRDFPLFFAIGTFVTIIFEIYFPVMVIFEKTKYFWLFLGIVFHLMIGLLLGLMPFSIVMIATYVLFVDKKFLNKLFASLNHRFF